MYVETRQNPIVNRLNKTKKEREANLEQELQDKLRKEKNESRAVAAKKVRAWDDDHRLNLILISYLFQRKEDEELARKREEEKKARDYALLDQVDEEEQTPQYNSVQEMMDDFM